MEIRSFGELLIISAVMAPIIYLLSVITGHGDMAGFLAIVGVIVLVISYLEDKDKASSTDQTRNLTQRVHGFTRTQDDLFQPLSDRGYLFKKGRVRGPIITKVVGVSFEGRQSVIEDLATGELLRLVREPTNVYDPNAVKVVRLNGQMIGYLRRELAKDLQQIYQPFNFPQYAHVVKIIGDRRKGQTLGVVIEIHPLL